MFSQFCLRGGVWLVLLLTMALPVMAQTETNEGQIVFVCGGDICIVNPDGSGLLQLTSGNVTVDYGDPRFSPDGNQIAFVSSPNRYVRRTSFYSNEIYLMQSDGSNLHRLTYFNGQIWGLDWSSDGTEIVFSLHQYDSLWNLYVTNVDAGTWEPFVDLGGTGRSPDWSPAGNQVVLVAFNELLVSEVSDRSVRVLTDNGIWDKSPHWSPDGTQLAFSSGGTLNADPILDIYIMEADGSNLRQMTDTPMQEYVQGWSPDSQYILFSGSPQNEFDYQLYLLHIQDRSINPLFEEEMNVGLVGGADWSATANVTQVAPPVTAQENVPDGLWMETWAEDEVVCPTHEQRRPFANQPFLLTVAEDGDQLVVNYLLTGETISLPRAEPDFYYGALDGSGGEAFGESHVAWLTHMEYAFVERFAEDCQIYNSAAWDFVTDGAYCTLTATTNPNLRSGPATSYQQVGSLTAGDSTIAIAQATGDDGYVWYELYDNKWVRSDLVEAEASCTELPIQ